MATGAGYLAHTSVLTRLHLQDVLARVGALVVAGHVATHALVDLELLSTVRTAEAHRSLRLDLLALPRLPVSDQALERALDVQGLLAEQGRQRDVAAATLVTAAIAELAGLVVLHHDPAVDLVAEVTGQRADWVVPRAT